MNWLWPLVFSLEPWMVLVFLLFCYCYYLFIFKMLNPRFSCRFIFSQAVLMLYAPTFNKKEYHPTCLPTLPVSVLPTNNDFQMVVMQIASVFGTANNFVFSEGVGLPENRYGDMDVISN